MTKPDLSLLDEDQLRAATAPRGPVCILAGAGTGKTRTITYRIANLVDQGFVSPQRVLAVTFTARAAGEMRDRLRTMGVAGVQAQPHPAARQVFLLQRKKTKVGDGLGKTTGWIHRTGLKNKNVQMLNSVEYVKVDDAGLHIRIAGGEEQVLPVDTVIVCAGQDPLRELQQGLESAGQRVHLVGGADVAAELDAKRAIDQGSRLAAGL